MSILGYRDKTKYFETKHYHDSDSRGDLTTGGNLSHFSGKKKTEPFHSIITNPKQPKPNLILVA